MSVYQILNKLESEIRNGKPLPMTKGKAVYDKRRLMELVDKLRMSLEEQQRKMSQREQDVQREVKERIREAIENTDIVKQAQTQAENIIKRAQEEAESIVRDAENYALKLITLLESELSKVMSKTREIKARITSELKSKTGVKFGKNGSQKTEKGEDYITILRRR